MVGRIDTTADFFTMVVEQILSSDHVFPGLTYFDLLGVLVDITVVFIIRECVITHEFHFCKEFLPSLVFTRNHSVLSSAHSPLSISETHFDFTQRDRIRNDLVVIR